MRWILPGVLFSLLAVEAAAQQEIEHNRVRRFIGEEVTVTGPVARVAPASQGSLWVSIGRPHPSASLVIVVESEFVKNLDEPRSLEGATVKVTGRIFTGEAAETGISRGTSTPQLAGGNPRTPFIVLRDASRLQVVTRPGTVPDTGTVGFPR
jgi:hypothetical protein